MARLLQITLIFAGAALAYAMDSAEELAPQEGNDAVYEPSDFRYKRTPFLTLPRLTWGWPSPPIDRDRLAYEVGKKNSGRNMHRRFAFGIGKRNPYDRYFDGDEYGNSRYMYDAPPRQYRQKKYDFGLGKREVSTADLMEMQKEEQQQQQHRVKRSLEQVNDDNDDDDVDVDELMEQRLQRGSYKFGLGKRKNFNFGLGKRYYEDVDDDSDDDGYLYQEDKRGKSYSFGLGKRGNGNKQYSFGLGKREDEDLEMDEIKRAKAYGFGLGKRERNSKNYNFGLGKKSKNYSFGLGKREDSESSANEDKRGRKGNQYGFGLGKRAQVDAAETQNAVSNNAHAESSNNDV